MPLPHGHILQDSPLMEIAYVSQGTLYLKNGDGSARRLESKFARELKQRALEIHQKHAWKGEGRAGYFSGQALWGVNTEDPLAINVSVTGLSRGCTSDELFYTMVIGNIAGVFKLNKEAGAEMRLLHTAEYRLQGVAARHGAGQIACVVSYKSGLAHIAIMADADSSPADVTEGDSVDLAPAWAGADSNNLIFQSAGIARDDAGRLHGRGPFTIQSIDLDTGDLTCLAEESGYDLVCPRMDADGALYYVKRPYSKPGQPDRSFFRSIPDIFLMPFRMLYAVFQFLNWFTIKYTGRTLTTAGGAAQKEIDLKRQKILSNTIDAEASAHRELLDSLEKRGTVADSWQLIRKRQGKSPETLAKGVLAYDLGDSGDIIYSNGNTLHRISDDDASRAILTGDLIEHVAFV
jgi:hypothetical protein